MTLALHGGTPARTRPFPPRPQYGIAERNAANSVVASGNLSGFLAESGESFLGGPKVRDLERAWCEKFGVAHAVAMNSGTSCLFAAVKALGIGPGDEVIVTPWSMSASATCVLAAGAVPVFADIEPETYGLSYQSVADHITPKTRAIVMVDLFGCIPRDLDAIQAFGLPIIEDAAQAIGAILRKPTPYTPARRPPKPLPSHSARTESDDPRYTGTFGQVGVYSLNRHKQITCGEGGVAVTEDDDTADRLREYRNHGEVIGGILGGNYRMGEVEAAIAEVQLGRLEELTEPRIRNARILNFQLAKLDGVSVPTPPQPEGHVYYLYAIRTTEDARKLVPAICAEGVPVSRYVEPLYLLPRLRGYGRINDSNQWLAWYPEVERAYREVIVLPHIHAGITSTEDLDDIVKAFEKVWTHREEL